MKNLIFVFSFSICAIAFSQMQGEINQGWIKHFDSLRIIYPSLESDIKKSYVFDITGDDIPEEMIYTYSFKNDTFYIARDIYEGKSKKNVLSEKINYTVEYLFEDFFQRDSLFFNNYPYSGLSAVLMHDTSYYFQESRFQDAEFINDAVVKHYISRYESEFPKYLLSYKGLMMNELSIEPGAMLIWYEPKQEFRIIYAA